MNLEDIKKKFSAKPVEISFVDSDYPSAYIKTDNPDITLRINMGIPRVIWPEGVHRFAKVPVYSGTPSRKELFSAVFFQDEKYLFNISEIFLERFCVFQQLKFSIKDQPIKDIEDSFKKLADWIDWSVLHDKELLQKLSEKFIESFKDEFDWDFISMEIELDEFLLFKLDKYLNFDFLSKNQPLTEKYLTSKLEKDITKCNSVFANKAMPEVIIRKYAHEITSESAWNQISMNSGLSIEFLREFKHKLNWFSVSSLYKFNEESLREFWDETNFEALQLNVKIPKKLKRKFGINFDHKHKLSLQEIDEPFLRKWIKKILRKFLNKP